MCALWQQIISVDPNIAILLMSKWLPSIIRKIARIPWAIRRPFGSGLVIRYLNQSRLLRPKGSGSRSLAFPNGEPPYSRSRKAFPPRAVPLHVGSTRTTGERPTEITHNPSCHAAAQTSSATLPLCYVRHFPRESPDIALETATLRGWASRCARRRSSRETTASPRSDLPPASVAPRDNDCPSARTHEHAHNTVPRAPPAISGSAPDRPRRSRQVKPTPVILRILFVARCHARTSDTRDTHPFATGLRKGLTMSTLHHNPSVTSTYLANNEP